MRRSVKSYVALGATVALAAMGSLSLASIASAGLGCDTWSGGNGDWDTGSWSGGAPGVGSAVCINSGTVTISGTDTIPSELASISIGSGGGLDVGIHNVVNSSSTTIAVGGTLTLDGTYHGSNAGNAALGGGPVTNQGTINMEGSGYSATLYGTIVNQGTLNVVNNTVQICYGGNGGAGSFDNKGTINIAAMSTAPNNAPVLQVVGCTFTNDTGGNIVNDGGFIVDPSGSPASPASYVQGSGTETGNNVIVHAGATLAYTGTGASNVEVNSSTSMTGNIASGQSLQVDIGTVVTEPGSFTNAGTILLNGNYYGGGGGPAEIAIPSGTITNTGTLTADSNDNDPSISGNFVNNGTVVITPNTELEQLAGNFTNGSSGSFEPEISSAHDSDMRLDTGTAFIAGGNLAPQLVGGYTPPIGEEHQVIRLRGGSATGTFAAVVGNWHADYAISSNYIGAVYGPGPSTGGGSGGSSTSGTTPGTPTATGLSGGAAEIKLAVSCGSGSCLTYKLTGTVTEHLKAGRVTAVAARAGEKTKGASAGTRVVTVARASGPVTAGKSQSLTIKLNGAGKALLKRFGRLRVHVTVTAGTSTIRSGTVTVTKPKAKTKQKR